ncbi:MAG: hypothetical protein V3R83_12380 [Gammaproteobacteria bacterium]
MNIQALKMGKVQAILWIVYIGTGILIVQSIPTYGPGSTPVFATGEIVEMAVSGTKGMVMNSTCYRSIDGRKEPCTYDVRFSFGQLKTDVSLFGEDGFISTSPHFIVTGLKEFELRKVQE